ncbi:hypothetical protein [Actinoplanes subglobosus]|uniref:Uncharacterized protein n=1 Tax=Actinoplanes subglobosus TaxID=1547892 RepID=A0ABV8J9T3_9ACTN
MAFLDVVAPGFGFTAPEALAAAETMRWRPALGTPGAEVVRAG